MDAGTLPAQSSMTAIREIATTKSDEKRLEQEMSGRRKGFLSVSAVMRGARTGPFSEAQLGPPRPTCSGYLKPQAKCRSAVPCVIAVAAGV